MKNWNNQEIEIAISKGGVIALSNPYDNLISTGISPWPPSEIVQKLYNSRQSRAYIGDNKGRATGFLGYYSDLQSIHSEDAITWSVFGTVSRATPPIRNRWIEDLFGIIGLGGQNINHSEIFLWRRIPHPDTLVSGGPEIDFGIYTGNIILFGEAKWRSSVDASQGKNKNKDQIQLRIEFLSKYGRNMYPFANMFVVLGIGMNNDVTGNSQDATVRCIGTTWDEVCDLNSHPMASELRRYLDWKKGYANNG